MNTGGRTKEKFRLSAIRWVPGYERSAGRRRIRSKSKARQVRIKGPPHEEEGQDPDRVPPHFHDRRGVAGDGLDELCERRRDHPCLNNRKKILKPKSVLPLGRGAVKWSAPASHFLFSSWGIPSFHHHKKKFKKERFTLMIPVASPAMTHEPENIAASENVLKEGERT